MLIIQVRGRKYLTILLKIKKDEIRYFFNPYCGFIKNRYNARINK